MHNSAQAAPPPPRFGLPEADADDNLFNVCFNLMRIVCPDLLNHTNAFRAYALSPDLPNLKACKAILGAPLLNARDPGEFLNGLLLRTELMSAQCVGVDLKTWKRCGRCGAQRNERTGPERSRHFVLRLPPTAPGTDRPPQRPTDIFANAVESSFTPASPHDGCPFGSVVANRDVLDMQQALLFAAADAGNSSGLAIERDLKLTLSDRSCKTYRAVAVICRMQDTADFAVLLRDQNKQWWLCHGLSVTATNDPTTAEGQLHACLIAYLDVSRHFPDWRQVMPRSDVLVPDELVRGRTLPVSMQLSLANWPDVLDTLDALQRLTTSCRALIEEEHEAHLLLEAHFYRAAFRHSVAAAAAASSSAAVSSGLAGSVSSPATAGSQRYASFRGSPLTERSASTVPGGGVAFSIDALGESAAMAAASRRNIDAALSAVSQSADAVLTSVLLVRLRRQTRVERRNGAAEVAMVLGTDAGEIPVEEAIKERTESDQRARAIANGVDTAFKSVARALKTQRAPRAETLRLLRSAPDAMRHVTAQRLLARRYPHPNDFGGDDDAAALLTARALQFDFAVSLWSTRLTPTVTVNDVLAEFLSDHRVRAAVVGEVSEKSAFRPSSTMPPAPSPGGSLTMSSVLIGSNRDYVAYSTTEPTHTHSLDTRPAVLHDAVIAARDVTFGGAAFALSIALPGTSQRERFHFSALVLPVARETSVVLVAARLPSFGSEERFRHQQRTRLRRDVASQVHAYLQDHHLSAVAWIAVGDFRLQEGDKTDGYFPLPTGGGAGAAGHDNWGYTWGYLGAAAFTVQLTRLAKPSAPCSTAAYFRLTWTHLEPRFDELVAAAAAESVTASDSEEEEYEEYEEEEESVLDEEEDDDEDDDEDEEWDDEEEVEHEGSDKEEEQHDEEELTVDGTGGGEATAQPLMSTRPDLTQPPEVAASNDCGDSVVPVASAEDDAVPTATQTNGEATTPAPGDASSQMESGTVEASPSP